MHRKSMSSSRVGGGGELKKGEERNVLALKKGSAVPRRRELLANKPSALGRAGGGVVLKADFRKGG